MNISKRDLRMLLHWAAYGVAKAQGGAYEDEILGVIRSNAKSIGFRVGRLEFGQSIPRPPEPKQ